MSSSSKSASGSRGARRFAIAGILLLVAMAVALMLAFGDMLTLEALAARRSELAELVARHAVPAAIAFAIFYALVTAAMVPGVALFTVAAGFLFGIAMASVLVVIGATVGATALFLLARTAFGEALRRRAGPGFARIEAGFRENAFSYLLFLRLVPVFPFFLVNVGASLTGVRLSTYVVATAIGIVPAVVAYSALGAGLDAALAAGQAPTLADALSVELLAGLAGLGVLVLLPVAWRALAGRRQRGGGRQAADGADEPRR